MEYAPDRGRIIIVNFELGGKNPPPEMCKPSRPCLVVHNNKIRRGKLATVVPLSTTVPDHVEVYHHLMDHRSFLNWPLNWDGQGNPRYALCDHIVTISLRRCKDPYYFDRGGNRRSVKVKAIKADMEAIERGILWALGINLPITPQA